MFEKRIVIDCRGHLLGRLASIIAKELLSGQKIRCVRAEELNISGTFARNKVKYLAFLRKRCNVNPSKGPYHFKSPSRIFWRSIRGMLPHKTARGAAALKRLRIYEGVPPAYQRVKRLVVPSALRYLRLGKNRPYTVLGDISKEFGWKNGEVVKKLEDTRKSRSFLLVKRTKALNLIRRRAEEQAQDQLKKLNAEQILSQFGYNSTVNLVPISQPARKNAPKRAPRVKKDKNGQIIKAKFRHFKRTAKAFKYPLAEALIYKKKKDEASYKKRQEKFAAKKAKGLKNHAARVKAKRATERNQRKKLAKKNKTFRQNPKNLPKKTAATAK
jgi:large subunit ribosomal protein L13Ae